MQSSHGGWYDCLLYRVGGWWCSCRNVVFFPNLYCHHGQYETSHHDLAILYVKFISLRRSTDPPELWTEKDKISIIRQDHLKYKTTEKKWLSKTIETLHLFLKSFDIFSPKFQSQIVPPTKKQTTKAPPNFPKCLQQKFGQVTHNAPYDSMSRILIRDVG